MLQIKFLIDENVDFSVATFLRAEGFDVKTVVETKPSLEDKDVLALAIQENRILITNDKDFGRLVFKDKLSSTGIILLRLEDESSQLKIERLKAVLLRFKEKLPNNFLVITEDKVRINEL